MDQDLKNARPAVLLASALHLLSASALNGPSAMRSAALLNHLNGIANNEAVDPLLRQVCQELLQDWRVELAECQHCANSAESSLLH